MAILDNFHFDLTKSKGISCNLKEPPKSKARKFQPPEANEETIDNMELQDEVHDDGKFYFQQNFIRTPIVKFCVILLLDIEIKKDDIDIEKATKIHLIVARTILPKLHSCLNQKVNHSFILRKYKINTT